MIPLNWEFPHASRRMPVLGRNVVATSQPLAAQAGIRMLLKGGNAVDAAVATAIALTVVEPTMNGIGGDSFALVWDGERLHGLNASGRSPAAWDFNRFSGFERMPLSGWDAVTVPGAVSSWVELSARFGKLSFETLFEPAIHYARDGFPVSPITASLWRHAAEIYRDSPGFRTTFLLHGRAPRTGETFRCREQARTLEMIAETKGRAFYEGELAEAITGYAKATGGLLTEEDLAMHRADWVEPLSVTYRGFNIHELPPNGQGIAALIVMGILSHWDMTADHPDSAQSLHLQIEAMKLAFADLYRYVSDPSSMELDYRKLIEPGYLSERAALIDPERAGDFDHGTPPRGDTVYLTAADAGGVMVSFIQSNYTGFGSGIVVPGTGISLHNRGACFTTQKGHPNQVEGSKRPLHTIIPAFVSRDGAPEMSFGVMGGPMQPQGHGQILVRIVDHGQNPQAASDAPRWQVLHGREVALEQGFSHTVAEELKKRGHRVIMADQQWFGGAQIVLRLADGYCAASDHRKDGQAVGF
ncbi:MAG TPA: gamma-glutamyltransferase family protein [Dissulfurispiraceae bacterium]|nr:gamma-glutamyltransferase family protein [Dissulfurispiraceae bacterium]